ncbi:uncharacterized protein LOC142642791 [Castanea sativa]|uniref:uncharacterized protein LOC142642791 n=1 Tax=Castanea sativa TaxID=21020 RepID=UPI003F64B150
MVNLHKRQIVQNVSCNLCNDHPEDVLHAVWFCKEISSVWDSLDWFHQLVTAPPVCFRDLLARFLHYREEYRAEIFVIVAWLLWNRRNALHFGRPALPVATICGKAGSYLQGFLQAQSKVPGQSQTPIAQQWRPPDSHCFKVNFDAAVFRALHRAGIGVIVCDWNGAVLGALSSSIPLAQSVADVEALACLKAVSFAQEIGLTRVVFEGDSAIIIGALNQATGEVANYGNIIEDIRQQVGVFQFVVFSHTSRVCNSVADALAKKAKVVMVEQLWLGDIPSDIAPLVYLDIH